MARLTTPQRTAVEGFLTELDTRRAALQTLLSDLKTAKAPATFISEGLNVDRAAMNLILSVEGFLRRDSDLI